MTGCGGGDKPKFTEEELARIPHPQRIGLPKCSGGFALAVSGESITADEIIAPLAEHFRAVAQRSDYRQFKEQTQPAIEQVLMSRVSDILLYQKARRHVPEQADEAVEKAVEAEVRKFVIGFEGDYARAEQTLKEMGMDWADFREYQKKMVLCQSYIVSKMPEKKAVTYSELIDGYNEIKDEFFVTPAMLKFQLIDIETAKLEVTDPNRSRLEQAWELADELMSRLRAGEDFAELATAYSHGHRRQFGGLWKPVQPDSLAKPYDILAAEAEQTEPGQLAGPIEADEHIFIMKLVEKRPKGVEPFEKVQKEIEAKIIFERRRQAIDEFTTKLAQQATLNGKEEFTEFCLEEIYWMCNQ
jgi:parvulin-like peptidyl-prolyl isomerase